MARRKRVASTRTIGSICGSNVDVAAQHLDADGVALEALAAAAQHRFDDEQKKRRELRRVGEDFAGGHALDLCAHLTGGRRAVLLRSMRKPWRERLVCEAAADRRATAALCRCHPPPQ